jgi:hypothetical protein
MKNVLFPNFLRDAREYDGAQCLWQSRWQEVVNAAGQEDRWESPWLNTTFADGTPCRDGNPIFSAVNHKGRLGIRVIQQEPGKNPHEISHWTGEFDEEGRKPIKELVISCALTERTLQEAVGLMKQFLVRKRGRKRPLARKKR